MFALPQARLRLIFVAALPLALLFGAIDASLVGGQRAAPRFECANDASWVIGARLADWRGDTAAVGSALPDGYLAAVAVDPTGREFRLWLYDGDDTHLTVPFHRLVHEPGTEFPTGRPDFIGAPTIFYHDGQIKILVRAWNGGGNGPAPLMRIYTGCGLR